MNKKGKFLITLLLLVFLLTAGVIAYRYFSSAKNETVPFTPSASQSDTTEDTSSAKESEPAADFTVTDDNGNAVNLSDFSGKPVVVNFWATWCPPCRAELPAFQEAYHTDGDTITFMMVNLTDGSNDTVDGVRQFISENDYDFPIYYDEAQSAATAYGVYSIPMTLFITSDGKLQNYHIGAMDSETLQSYLDQLK